MHNRQNTTAKWYRRLPRPFTLVALASLCSSLAVILIIYIADARWCAKDFKCSTEARGPFVYAPPHDYVPPPLHPSYTRVLDALPADDRLLLPEMQEEYMSLSLLDDPKCGTWQKRYRELHNAVISNTASKPKTIMYHCRDSKLRGKECGGLADRFFGMVSTFMFALLDGRAFLAKWDVPFMLEDLFDAPSVDWSAQILDRGHVQEFNWLQYSKENVTSTFTDTKETWEELFPEPHLTFVTNRGMAIGLARSKKYGPRIKEMGLTVDTIFGCTMDFIIKPKPTILQFIAKFAGLFHLPSVFSVGIQIRSGDISMLKPELDQSPFSNYEHYFTCADQLSRVYAKENQVVVYFLVTDSIHLREEATKRYSQSFAKGESERHILISGVPIAHSHYGRDVEGVVGSIVEQWALSATDYRVVTDQSGFGKIAAFRSRAQNTTVSLSLTGPAPDCSKFSAFTSFESLASEWSLG